MMVDMTTMEDIRALLLAQPFIPFKVHVRSGEIYPVTQADQVYMAGSRMSIYYADGDQMYWCSFSYIDRIEMWPPRQ